jgi:Phytanoyl-CoA dioxygenase (PhyH)
MNAMEVRAKCAEMVNDLSQFDRDGFAIVGPLASEATLAALREEYDRVLNREIECGPLDRQLGNLTRQVMHPDLYRPLFKDNEVLERGRAVAQRLLETPDPKFYFSMLIFKPPAHPHATPWHQDLAYLQRPFAKAGLQPPKSALAQFWMPLDDVDTSMGCMEFRPGVHRDPLLAHHVCSGDPEQDERLLAIDDHTLAGLPSPVACPVPAGWATVHALNTPHYTGPNRSSRPRRAYIFSYINEDVFTGYQTAHPVASNRPQPVIQ